MLDINFIRNNLDIIRDSAIKKSVSVDIDRLIIVDENRRAAIQALEVKQATQNQVTDLIPQELDLEKKRDLIESMKSLKSEIQVAEELLRDIMIEWNSLMLEVPNVPDASVPIGKGEDENVVVKEWGDKNKIHFEPKDHVELMTKLDMVDFVRGVKVHGFRGYFMKNDGVALMWAIWNYARDFYKQYSYQEFLPPAIVRPSHFYGTGHLPGDADDLFQTQDNDHLSGTAEVPMMGYYSDEVLPANALPFKALAFSPCYRREAGSHSRDTKGLIRVHEFYKLEQLILCEANHLESVRLHEEMNESFEKFLESLQIPYQRLLICSGDLSKSKVKQYDVEAWVPSQNQYRELSSASYFHDFQTRRFNIRYTDSQGKKQFAHSLNNTAAATPRLLVALVENYQLADGRIEVPLVLQPYMKKAVIERS